MIIDYYKGKDTLTVRDNEYIIKDRMGDVKLNQWYSNDESIICRAENKDAWVVLVSSTKKVKASFGWDSRSGDLGDKAKKEAFKYKTVFAVPSDDE